MYELKVCASKNYTVTINDGLDLFRERALPFLAGEKVAIVTDDKVYKLHGGALDKFLTDKKVVKILVKHGEKSKNAKNYLRILNILAENGFTRADAVIAFGGGVVGDLAGFAASTYMRGITLIAVPTTLLAMVDSSVGGKTAIDLDAGKNLCGTFYQPSAVYVNTEFLKTLPRKEVKNGLGEIVKYAFLSDTVTISDIKALNGELIYKCLKIKRDVVEKDEKESGDRALLNLGHTVGHAIEKLSGYKLPHGQCVAKGLAYTVAVSERVFGLSEAVTRRMLKLLDSVKIDLTNTFSAEEIAECIKADKKRNAASINFAAVKDVGKAEMVKIKLSELKEIMKEYESKRNAV